MLAASPEATSNAAQKGNADEACLASIPPAAAGADSRCRRAGRLFADTLIMDNGDRLSGASRTWKRASSASIPATPAKSASISRRSTARLRYLRIGANQSFRGRRPELRAHGLSNYPALRLALRFDHWLIARRIQLFHNSEVLIGLDGLRKSFADTKTGLRMPLLDNFVASLEYDVDWDGNPVPGNVTTDRTFVFSLGYHGRRRGHSGGTDKRRPELAQRQLTLETSWGTQLVIELL